MSDNAARTFSIFISSPGDVNAERIVLTRVAQRLHAEFSPDLGVRTVIWERLPLRATAHFQEEIPNPAVADAMVLITWTRLGTVLPPERFRGRLSGVPVTGTQWEFEEALHGATERGTPDLLAYRKTAPRQISVGDRRAAEDAHDQIEALEAFHRRWFVDERSDRPLRAWHAFQGTDEFEDLVETHLRQLIQRRLSSAGTSGRKRWSGKSPYLGLRSFELGDTEAFFGRRRERHQLRAVLLEQVDRGRPFVLVTGASGSGKSSLVKAGLLADLTTPGLAGRASFVAHAVMRPGEPGGPLRALARAMTSPTGLGELGDPQSVETMLAGPLPAVSAAAARALDRASARVRAQPSGAMCLVIDQLEELLDPRISGDDRTRFADLVAALVSAGVWVVAVMRDDLVHGLQGVPALTKLVADGRPFVVTAPTDAAIAQIVTGPARAVGLAFEGATADHPALEERIAADAKGVSLPLLSFALEELVRAHGDTGLLTHSAYDGIGGVEGALAKHATAVLAALPPDLRDALEPVIRRLITVDPTGARGVMARAVARSEFGADTPAAALVDRLMSREARLLTAEGDGVASRVRIAHETLFRTVEEFRAYIDRDRRFLAIMARVKLAASLWSAAGAKDRPSMLLPEGLPLSEGVELLARRGEELSESEREFVVLSRSASERARRRTRNRLLAAIAALTVLASGAVVFGWVALRESNRANQAAAQSAIDAGIANAAQAVANEKRLLAEDAQHTAQWEGMAGNLLAADYALRLGEPGSVVNARLDAIAERFRRTPEYLLLRAAADRSLKSYSVADDPSPVLAVAFVNQGRELLITHRSGRVVHWDVEASNPGPQGLPASGFPFSPAVAAPASNAALVTEDARTPRVLRLDAGGSSVRLGEQGTWVTRLAWADDGRTAVIGAFDGGLSVWDAASGARVADLRGHHAPITAVGLARTRAGEVVCASGDNAGRLMVHTVPSGRVLLDVQGSAEIASLSVTGDRLLVADAEGHVFSRAPITASPVALPDHAAAVRSMAMSSDGTVAAAGAEDGSIHLLDFRGGTPRVSVLASHAGPVRTLQFAPRGDRLLSASLDSTARVWRLDGGATPIAASLESTLRGHLEAVRAAAFAGDGATVATGADDGRVLLWDVQAAPVRTRLSALPGEVTALAVHPWTDVLAVGSRDGQIALWDLAGLRPLARWKAQPAEVTRIAFSKDGLQLACGAADGRVRCWALPGLDGAVEFGPPGPASRAAEEEDAGEGEEQAPVADHAAAVTGLAFTPRGTLMACRRDGSVGVYNAATGERLTSIGLDHAVAAAINSEGTILATIDADGVATVTNLSNATRLGAIRLMDASLDHGVLSFGVSEDGSSVCASLGRGVSVLGRPSHAPTMVGEETEAEQPEVEAAAPRGDGDAPRAGTPLPAQGSAGAGPTDWLQPGQSRQVRSFASGGLVMEYLPSSGGEGAGEASPRMLLAALDGTARLIDAGNGRELLAVPSTGSEVLSIAVGREQQLIAFGSRDATAEVWHLVSAPERLRTLRASREGMIAAEALLRQDPVAAGQALRDPATPADVRSGVLKLLLLRAQPSAPTAR